MDNINLNRSGYSKPSTFDHFIASKIGKCRLDLKQNTLYIVQSPAKCSSSDQEIINYGNEWAICMKNADPKFLNEYCGFYENYSGIFTLALSGLGIFFFVIFAAPILFCCRLNLYYLTPNIPFYIIYDKHGVNYIY